MKLSIGLATLALSIADGFTVTRQWSLSTCRKGTLEESSADRRSTLISITTVGISTFAASALAEPKEFSEIGTTAPPPDGEKPFSTLPSGVRTKDIKEGAGDVAAAGSTVSVQCNGRLLNLNGVSFYNTKNNNPDGFGPTPLTFKIGAGVALPGLEEGIIGMKKGGIRRIIVPSALGYSSFPGLEPKPMNAIDQQALDSVVKNPRRDSTLLFDVKLEKLK